MTLFLHNISTSYSKNGFHVPSTANPAFKILRRIIICLLLIVVVGNVSGTNKTWDGSSSNDWNTSANWTPSGVPGTLDDVTIGNSILNNQPTLNSNTTINSLTILGRSGTNGTRGVYLTVSNGVILTINNDLTISGSTSTGTMGNCGLTCGGNASISIGGNLTTNDATNGGDQPDFVVGSGTITIAGNLSLSGNTPFTSGTSTFNFSKASGTQTVNNGAVNNFFNITHSGTGTLQISTNPFEASNSFNNSGGGTVDLNALALTIGDLQGNGTITNSATGTVILTSGNDNVNTTFSGIIQNGSGTFALIKVGTGILTLSGANTYTGATTITSGELRLNPTINTTPATQIILNGGTLSTTGISTSRSITNSSTLQLTDNSILNLGSNSHSLIFRASNSISWTAGKTLIINGWSGSYNSTSGNGGKLFVGNSNTGLTAIQLSQIRFFNGTENYSAIILSTGEVVPTNNIAPVLSYTSPNIFIRNFAITPLSPTALHFTPTSFSVSPTLPTGLNLDITTGIISGTPSSNSAAADFTVTATGGGNSASYVVNITVRDAFDRYAISDGLWNDMSIWSNTSTGLGGQSVPVDGDNVYIERNRTVTVNVTNAACANLTLGRITGTNSGSGTITFAVSGNPSLLVSGNIQVGGSSNNGSNGTITFVNGSSMTAGSLTMGDNTRSSNGTITMANGSTLTMNGAFTIGKGGGTYTWAPGTGTVIMNVTNTLPTSVFTTFNNLNTTSGTTTLGVNISITGNLNIGTSTSLDLATYTANRSATGGTLSVAGTMLLGSNTGGQTGSNFPKNFSMITLTGGTVEYDYAGNQTVYSTSYNNLTLTGTGTKSLTANTSIGGDMTVNSGARFDLGTYTANRITNGGNLTLTGTMYLGGTSGGQTGSNFPTNFSSLTMTGGTVYYDNSTGGQTIYSIPVYNNLIIGNTSGNQTTDGALTVRGNMTISSGAMLSGGDYNHFISGNWINNSGTFNSGAGTITFNGTTQNIGGTSTTTFNNLTLAGSGIKTFANATTINNNITINTGVKANLGALLNHNASFLTLGSISQANGTWGSATATTATNHDDNYFASNTGILTVSTPPTITCPPSITAFSNPQTGLITAYPFNETSGAVAYDVIGNKNADLINSPTWNTSGNSVGSVTLDGGVGSASTSDYIQLPTGIVSSLTGDFSISTWVYWADPSNNDWQRIFDFGSSTTNYMFLTTKSGNYPRFAINNGSGEQQLTGTSALTKNTWHHFVITLSGNTGTFYIDGSSVTTNTNMTSHPSSLGNTPNNWIGKSQFINDSYFNGKIDEFRIYNVALTSTQVTTLFGANSCTASADYGSGLGIPTVANGSGKVTVINNASFPLSLGANSITWTAKDALNRTSTCNQSVTAITSPPTFSGALADQLVTNNTYTLIGGLPTGGTYSGTGVTGTNFNASVAGPGTYTITYSFNYTYADGTSCTKTATNTVHVYAPIVTVTPTTLTGFTYPVGYGPSGEKLLTVSGVNLTTNITILPTDTFEISLTSGDLFAPQSLISLLVTNGTVPSTTIYVRMKAGLGLGTFAPVNTINCLSDNAVTQKTSCSGSVTATPTINPVTLTDFNYTFTAGPSATQNFVASGTNLSSNIITITPSDSYEISLSATIGFGSTPLSVASGTTIYVRMIIALGVGSYNENIVLTSNYVNPVNIICKGTVNAAPTIFTSTSSLSGFVYKGPAASYSAEQSFTVTAANLINDITITAPANFKISKTSGTGFGSTLTLTKTGSVITPNPTTIYVRMEAGIAQLTVAPINLTLSSTGATTQNITLSGRVVTTTPTLITSVSALSGFTYFLGAGISPVQSFNVSGADLSSSIKITPTANYEISLSAGGPYQTTAISLTNAATVNPTTIYVRLQLGLGVNNYNYTGTSGMSVTSGATTLRIDCSGSVTNAPTILASITNGGSVCPNTTVNLTSTGSNLINQYWQGPNGFYDINPIVNLGNLTDGTKNGTYTVYGNALTGPNLITNGDFELGNTGFGSSYVNNQSSVTSEGTYAVVANPHDVHSDFTTNVDHTPTGTMQMVINGATTAGAVVWSQTVTVETNSNYQFNYYIQSMVNNNASRLQLYVNGVKAGPIYVASLTIPLWSQFVYNVSSGGSTIVNLELINQNIVAGGNDFSLDDISLRKVFTVSSPVNLVVNTTLPVNVSIAASINPLYSGGSVTFTATPVNGGTSPSYQWKVNGTNAGTNSSSFTYTPAKNDVFTCVLTNNTSPCTTGNPATSSPLTATARTNFWLGKTDTDWGKATNWSDGFIPAPGNDVEYATVANNTIEAKNDLVLDQNRTIGSLLIGNLGNGNTRRLIIPPGKGLIVNNTISTNNADTTICIYSSATGPNGSLIFHNSVSYPVHATVQMYSKAFYNEGDPVDHRYHWQYFGIPVSSVIASPTLDGSYVRIWDESGTSTANHWVSLNNASELLPFKGYEITQKKPVTLVFSGKLINSDFNSGVLPITGTALYPGQHIFANPYTAAIDIRLLNFVPETEGTVYIYNTGTFADWTDNGSGGPGNRGTNPGQYTAIPYKTAGNLNLPRQIPSMQAFLVKAINSNATFSLNYSSVMYNDSVQRVRGAYGATTSGQTSTRIDVNGTIYSDRMWLFTQPGCSRNFDNGWDGAKMPGSALTPQIFAIEPDGNYQVNAVDDINNTQLGFQAGQDKEYTLTFTHQNLETNYSAMYLYDIAENKTVDITESGSTYSFTAESTPTYQKRFIIVTRKLENDSTVIGKQLKVFTSGNTVFVQNFGNLNGEMVLYDIMGHYLKKASFGPYGITAIQVGTITGAYIVKATTSNEKVSEKIIIGK